RGSTGSSSGPRARTAIPISEGMTPRLLIGFLFGRADAIRRVAAHPQALTTAIFLVLTASAARNYDQTFLPAAPFRWLLGSLVFSLVSGTLFFGALYFPLIRGPSRPLSRTGGSLSSYWTFMAVFWMTAPLAGT
ncbi:MAG: hypothetical protein MI757_14425, partial [Pirellulales bacterium]|nr:hypothetical protein [Pirellulales bacterium]